MSAFLVGSMIAAVAPGFEILLVGRLIQAAGAGVIMRLLMNVVLAIFPEDKRGGAMGLIGVYFRTGNWSDVRRISVRVQQSGQLWLVKHLNDLYFVTWRRCAGPVCHRSVEKWLSSAGIIGFQV
jgi:hypothetical protein